MHTGLLHVLCFRYIQIHIGIWYNTTVSLELECLRVHPEYIWTLRSDSRKISVSTLANDATTAVLSFRAGADLAWETERRPTPQLFADSKPRRSSPKFWMFSISAVYSHLSATCRIKLTGHFTDVLTSTGLSDTFEDCSIPCSHPPFSANLFVSSHSTPSKLQLPQSKDYLMQWSVSKTSSQSTR